MKAVCIDIFVGTSGLIRLCSIIYTDLDVLIAPTDSTRSCHPDVYR